MSYYDNFVVKIGKVRGKKKTQLWTRERKSLWMNKIKLVIEIN